MLDAMETVKNAESKAEEIIADAKKKAEQKKSDIVNKAEKVRVESIEKANDQAKKEMDALVSKCKTIDESTDREIANEAQELKDEASKNQKFRP